MKKIIFSLIFVLAAIVGYGQQVSTITDQIEGVTVLNVPISNSGSYQSLSIDLVCTQIGGTSEGTIVLQGGNTTSTYSTLSSTDFSNNVSYLTNDTLTVADAAVWKIIIDKPAFRYYNLRAVGGVGDTTQVVIKYTFKNN